MQFTGLKDKNSKEIYEGDFVSCRTSSEHPAEVYWDERTASWRLRFSGEVQYDKTYPLMWAREVVGNIYENPELAK